MPAVNIDFTALSSLTLPSTVTHSRAGLATQFDSTGKLTYAPNNLLTYSNTFSNAAWVKQAVAGGTTPVVTAGNPDVPSSAPSGATSTRLQVSRSGVGTSQIYQNVSTSASVIQALWMKSNTGAAQNVMFVDFNGSITNVVSVTTSWQQFYFKSAAANAGLIVGTTSSAWGAAADTTQDILIFSAAVSAVTYETTPRAGDQVITTSAAYYGPRFDYDPATLLPRGLLIEEARTNIALQSNAFSTAPWGLSVATLPASNTLSPDGTLDAWTLATGGTSYDSVYQTITAANATPYTLSIFAKKNTRTVLTVELRGAVGLTYDYSFDLNAGTATINGLAAGSPTGTITHVGNGWYRCTVTKTTTNTAPVAIIGYGDMLVGAGNLYIYGAQYEQGSFATSYTPTAASSVTRAADVVQLAGLALTTLQGASASAVVEASSLEGATGGSQTLLGANGVSNMFLRIVTSTVSSLSSDSTVLSASGSAAISAPFRSALAWGPSSRSIVLNGGAVGTDAKTYSGVTSAYLGVANTGAQYWINGWVSKLALYTSRLPDAKLQAKSVVGARF